MQRHEAEGSSGALVPCVVGRLLWATSDWDQETSQPPSTVHLTGAFFSLPSADTLACTCLAIHLISQLAENPDRKEESHLLAPAPAHETHNQTRMQLSLDLFLNF